MKLFLMRHAQAQEAKDKTDLLRELTETGKKEAAVAADFLKHSNIDKILVSAATRTKQTSEIIQDKIKCPKYEILPELYGSSPSAIIGIISQQASTDKTLLVIAHNPGIFKTALALMDGDSVKYDELLNDGMPTAKIITLDFPDMKSWGEIKKPS